MRNYRHIHLPLELTKSIPTSPSIAPTTKHISPTHMKTKEPDPKATLDQTHKMARTIAELQITLDVYKGLFQEIEDAEVILRDFHEIGGALKKSLSSHLIIGCAAIFSDPSKSRASKDSPDSENMSLKNLIEKYKGGLSNEAADLNDEICQIVVKIDLKDFRNKHVGHFDLDASLGNRIVPANIHSTDLDKLFGHGQRLINLIIRDAGLLPPRHSLAFSSQIPESRSTKLFLNRLRRKATDVTTGDKR